MGQLNLSDEEIDQLKKVHKYTHNNSMRENRIRVVLAFDSKKSKEEIKELFLIDLQTIRRYINDFQNYRMDSIDFEDRRKDKSGNKTDLNEQEITKVKEYLKDNIVTDAKEIQEYIRERFTLSYRKRLLTLFG